MYPMKKTNIHISLKHRHQLSGINIILFAGIVDMVLLTVKNFVLKQIYYCVNLSQDKTFFFQILKFSDFQI